MAVFILLSTAAGTGIVGIDLGMLSGLGTGGCGIILVGACDLSHLLTLHLTLNADTVKHGDGIGADGLVHGIDHVVAGHLVFIHGIALAICLKSDTLAQLIHVIDLFHPLSVNDT